LIYIPLRVQQLFGIKKGVYYKFKIQEEVEKEQAGGKKP